MVNESGQDNSLAMRVFIGNLTPKTCQRLSSSDWLEITFITEFMFQSKQCSINVILASFMSQPEKDNDPVQNLLDQQL